MPAGSAYTDEELERERVKDKAFFQQGQDPMQIRIELVCMLVLRGKNHDLDDDGVANS